VTFQTTITENVEATATVRLPHGKLTVQTTPPGATVLLGGRAVGPTPLTRERVSAGTKKLTLQAKDFPALELSVTVVDRGDVKISPALGSAFPVLDPAALYGRLTAVEEPRWPSKVITFEFSSEEPLR
jgi:hypothetical protein